jgi:2,3,4,5-tetrahydropyridine-2-carboxylate N-succinyltransferase
MNAGELAAFYERPAAAIAADPDFARAHEALLHALEDGHVRAAVQEPAGTWRAVPWVKQAILLGFRQGAVLRSEGPWGPFFDKGTYPPRVFQRTDEVRIVPGGTSVRRGAFLAPGVVLMPPAFVNVGAFIGSGTMIDSHALVGSCAQVGARVHLSAGTQVGGVLEPAQAVPVVIEDEVFLGALSGVFEGVLVRARAVLAAGVLLTRASVVHDLVRERQWRGEIPAGAVVVPGTRPAGGDYARQHGLQVQAPLIVKYRDAQTDAAVALEDALR